MDLACDLNFYPAPDVCLGSALPVPEAGLTLSVVPASPTPGRCLSVKVGKAGYHYLESAACGLVLVVRCSGYRFRNALPEKRSKRYDRVTPAVRLRRAAPVGFAVLRL